MSSVGLSSRFAAWRVLHDVRHGVPFDLAFDRAVADLEPEDRRLAHELAAGVFRTRSRLDDAIAPAVRRGLESVRPDLLDVLRLGTYQLHGLDRIPAHAALQTTVDVARRIGGTKVAGFANAVLRKVADRGIPPAGANLARQYSHPEWLVDRWIARFGPEETARLLEWNNSKPSLTIQPVGQSLDRLREEMLNAGIDVELAPYGAGLVVGATQPTDLPGFHEGHFIVQDPAQRLVAKYLRPDRGSVLVDACAAPGGKAIAMSSIARMVVAADFSRQRVARMRINLDRVADRSGVIHPVRADVARPPFSAVDAVLLDVPCLGTGAFGRNPDARWRVTPEALAHLASQAAIFLSASAELVRPGGLLLFATCSLEPEENDQQIARFLERDHRFAREPITDFPPELLTSDGDLTLLPQRTGTDGAYAARLRRIMP